MKIKNKLKFFIITSFISIIILMIAPIYSEYKYRMKISQIDNFLNFSKLNAKLLHEIEKERSIAIIYLSSDGKILNNILSKQIKNSDEVIEEYKEFVNSSSFPKINTIYIRELKKIAKIVATIKDVREQIYAKELNEVEVLEYYSDLNFHILNIFTINSRFMPESKIINDYINYTILLKAKEVSSIKRGIISSCFIKEEFTEEEREKIISLITEEESYKNLFKNGSTPKVEKFYKLNLETEEIKGERELLFNSLKNINSSEEFKIDVKKWFNIVAKNVKAYRNVDNFCINQLQKENRAKIDIYLYFIIVALSLLIILSVIYFSLIKDINRRIHTHDWII